MTCRRLKVDSFCGWTDPGKPFPSVSSVYANRRLSLVSYYSADVRDIWTFSSNYRQKSEYMSFSKCSSVHFTDTHVCCHLYCESVCDGFQKLEHIFQLGLFTDYYYHQTLKFKALWSHTSWRWTDAVGCMCLMTCCFTKCVVVHNTTYFCAWKANSQLDQMLVWQPSAATVCSEHREARNQQSKGSATYLANPPVFSFTNCSEKTLRRFGSLRELVSCIKSHTGTCSIKREASVSYCNVWKT